MSMITYAVLLANAQPNDLHALAILAGGEIIRTPNATQATEYQALAERLFGAEVITRFRRGAERTGDGTVWHTFDAVVAPGALVMIAQLASERLQLSRLPIPVAPPPAPSP